MTDAMATLNVRDASDGVSIIDIEGDVTAASEATLMEAYGRASAPGVRAIVLNFGGVDYMNSGGIGLLVSVLVRAQRQQQAMLGFGLSEHYRQILELTRIDEAIHIHDSEADALRAAAM